MATLLDAFNATAGLVSGILSVSDRERRKEADAKLAAQRIDMRRFMADEMLKFSQRTDWDNFEKEWNDDFSRKFDEYNAPDGPSAYKDEYTARIGNQMLDGLKADGDIALRKIVAQGRMNASGASIDNAIGKLRNEPATQNRLDEEFSLLDRRYDTGLDDPVRSAARKREAYDTAQFESTTSYLYDAVRKDPSLLKKSDKELSDWAMTHAPRLSATMRGADGNETQLASSRREVNDRAVQSAMRRIRDDQERNDAALTSEFSAISDDVSWSGKGADELVAEIRAQVEKIREMSMDAAKLSPEQAARQIAKLEGLLRPLTEKKGASATSSAGKAAFKAELEEMTERAAAAVVRGARNDIGGGYTNFYSARNKLDNDYRAVYMKWGMDYDGDRAKRLTDFIKPVTEEIARQHPELKAALAEYVKLPKEVLEKKLYRKNPDLQKETAEGLYAFVWDRLATSDMSGVTAEDLRGWRDEYLARVSADELDWLEANPKKVEKAYAKEKGFARAVRASEGDFVFTDIAGKEHVIGGNAVADRLRLLEGYEAEEIKSRTGAATVAPAGYEITEGGNDKSSVMTFSAYGEEKDESGNRRLIGTFKFASSEDGKRAVLMRKEGDGWVKEEKDDAARLSEKEKAKRTSADARKIVERDAAQRTERMEREARELIRQGIVPGGITKEEWDMMDDGIRFFEMMKFVKETGGLVRELPQK